MASNKLVRKRVNSPNSLVSFQQIVCRFEKLFEGSLKSDEFTLRLLDVFDGYQVQWRKAFTNLHSLFHVQKSEISRLSSLQEHTRNMLETEIEKRKHVEKSKKSLESKLNMIRQVLKENDVDGAKRHLEAIDLSISNADQLDRSAGSLLDPNNVSLDSSSESVVHLNPSTRFSKKLRRASSAGQTQPFRRSATKRELRSSSVQQLIVHRSDERRLSKSTSKLHQNGSQRIETINRLNRPHNFVSRTVLRMELCSACGRRITFGKVAYKCLTCRLTVHSSCRQRLIQTCVPPSASRPGPNHPTNAQAPPTSPRLFSAYVPLSPLTQNKHLGSSDPILSSPAFSRVGSKNLNLSILCPVDQYPRIPALVIHCVHEVMARGIETVGIYRVSGSEKHVRELYEKFLRSKNTPSLALIEDIHVVCGCLKLFLRSLDEPLVTFVQRQTLVSVSEEFPSNPSEAIQVVIDVLHNLPAPNRDTLSFIMLHLKNVARSTVCQMGEENLSKVFGPTLVGYSCRDPQLMQTVTETRAQQAVLRMLFAVPDDVYSTILSEAADSPKTDADKSTYFTPLTKNLDLSDLTPASTTRKLTGLGMSARKRFFPNLLSSHREIAGSTD